MHFGRVQLPIYFFFPQARLTGLFGPAPPLVPFCLLWHMCLPSPVSTPNPVLAGGGEGLFVLIILLAFCTLALSVDISSFPCAQCKNFPLPIYWWMRETPWCSSNIYTTPTQNPHIHPQIAAWFLLILSPSLNLTRLAHCNFISYSLHFCLSESGTLPLSMCNFSQQPRNF